MTAKQKALYWRRWSAVRRHLIDLAGMTPAEADEERHEIHRAALGRDKSSKDLTNRDLDAILDHFAQHLVLAEGPVRAKRSEEMPRKRRIWAIERLGLPETYLESICRDQFQTSDWRQLPQHQLDAFRFTATARSRTHAARVPAPSP